MSEKGTSNLVQMTSNQADKSPTRSTMLQCNESNMLNFKQKVTDGRIPNGKSKEDDKLGEEPSIEIDESNESQKKTNTLRTLGNV